MDRYKIIAHIYKLYVECRFRALNDMTYDFNALIATLTSVQWWASEYFEEGKLISAKCKMLKLRRRRFDSEDMIRNVTKIPFL